MKVSNINLSTRIWRVKIQGLPWWLSGKESICQCRRHGFDPWSGKIPVLDDHNGVVTHLEPDILECKVKWALGSIITNKGSDGIWAELFTILKDNAVKVLHSICQQIWKTQQWPQDWERPVFILIPKKGQCQRMFKLVYNCAHFTS